MYRPERDEMSFFKLPRDVIRHLLRYVGTDLAAQTIVSLQRTSKKFRNYLWKAVDRLDLNEWSTDVDPNTLLDRLDNNIVTFLDLTGYNYIDSKGNELSTSDILRRYPALEILKVDEIPESDFDELERTIPMHKCLNEIVTYGNDIKRYQMIGNYVHVVVKNSKKHWEKEELLDLPTVTFSTTKCMNTHQCDSSYKIDFGSELTSNGITIKGTTFLGGDDGSIFVVRKQNGAMRMIQHVIEHTDSVKCLFRLDKTDIILAASEDGTVSKWHWIGSKLNLICKYWFPEPVRFVAGLDESRIAVASTYSVYFIVNNHVREGIQLKEEIKDLDIKDTVLHWEAGRVPQIYLHAESCCYTSLNFEEVMEVRGRNMDRKGPFCHIYPDRADTAFADYSESFVTAVCSKPTIILLSSRMDDFYITARSVIKIKINWYSQLVETLSPRLSRAEIASKQFPECKCIWYSQDYLYAIFSNNRLYRWRLGIEGKFRGVNEQEDND